ncbi:MAG TPA: hypothetical protein PLA68_13480 [Panacibacter sp.]|nr:hypothetical protein [Panacibacter sp.]
MNNINSINPDSFVSEEVKSIMGTLPRGLVKASIVVLLSAAGVLLLICYKVKSPVMVYAQSASFESGNTFKAFIADNEKNKVSSGQRTLITVIDKTSNPFTVEGIVTGLPGTDGNGRTYVSIQLKNNISAQQMQQLPAALAVTASIVVEEQKMIDKVWN